MNSGQHLVESERARSRMRGTGRVLLLSGATSAVAAAGLATGWLEWSLILASPVFWLLVVAGLLAGAAVVVRARAEPDESPSSARLVPLSAWALVAAGVLVLAVGGGVSRALLVIAAPDPRLQVEAVRIGLTAAAGTGGGLALLLAFRRQRTTEISTGNEITDTAEKRITELYTRAVDQLGADRAIVRLGGLYALERLGDEHPKHRQTSVNVLCAYLRMVGAEPRRTGSIIENGQGHEMISNGARPLPADPYDDEVRRTAQTILVTHVRLPHRGSTDHDGTPQSAGDRDEDQRPVPFWGGINLDLQGARLVDLDLTDCQVRTAKLANAHLVGRTVFTRTVFTGPGRAVFTDAIFDGEIDSTDATFGGPAVFENTQFRGAATFVGSTFERAAAFEGSSFAEKADFRHVRFLGARDFAGASPASTTSHSAGD